MNIYLKSSEDDFAKNKFCRFYSNKQVIGPLIERGISISKEAELIRESKDGNALKLSKSSLSTNRKFYSDLLVKTGLLFTVMEEITEFLYPRKIAHLINDEKTSKLLWHRDSYHHLSKLVGPKPSPLKLAVYLTPVDKYSGVTGLSTNFLNQDFNNRYIDYGMASLLSRFAEFPSLAAGDALLFDGRLMHCRKRQTRGVYRNVVIFNLSRNYDDLPKIHAVDEYFYGLLKEAISTSSTYRIRFSELATN